MRVSTPILCLALLLAAGAAQAQSISTGIVNIKTGVGGAGLPVTLFVWDEEANAWTELARSHTGDNGRIEDFGPEATVTRGLYRLNFDLSAADLGGGEPFFPEIDAIFQITDPAADYDVPVLVSSYGYTVYRRD